MPFISHIGKVKVEVHEIRRTRNRPYLAVEPSGIGVLHTTEGGSVSGALSTFEKNADPPHFLVGEDRIIQCRPLGVRAGALNSKHGDIANRFAQVQIEMVARSKRALWLPEKSTLECTLLVIAFCAKHFGLPIARPDQGWLDDCSDMPGWARQVKNRRRRHAEAGLWPKAKGWWLHLEAPFQSHWDCGALRRHDMFIAARELIDGGAV